jgi:hypothetical protein
MRITKFFMIVVPVVALGLLGYWYTVKPVAPVVEVYETAETASTTPIEPAVVPVEVVTASTSPEVLNVSLGQTANTINFYLTPLELIEDSRCPADVVCIQAGTVRVRATLVTPTQITERTFTLGMPILLENFTVTLVAVAPEMEGKSKLRAKDYQFSFSIVTN